MKNDGLEYSIDRVGYNKTGTTEDNQISARDNNSPRLRLQMEKKIPVLGIQMCCLLLIMVMVFTSFAGIGMGANASGVIVKNGSKPLDLSKDGLHLRNDTRSISNAASVNITYPQPYDYTPKERLANYTGAAGGSNVVPGPLSPQALMSTDLLHGRVTDGNGNALSGAYIFIPSAHLMGISDSNGYYSISYADGQFWNSYPAIVNCHGKMTVTGDIWLGSPDNTWNIVMSTSACTLHGRITSEEGFPYNGSYITIPSAMRAAWADYFGYYWIVYPSGTFCGNYAAQISYNAKLNVNGYIWLGSSDNTWNIALLPGHAVHGRVVDGMTLRPLNGVTISFQNTGLTTTTDFNGFYSVSYSSISPIDYYTASASKANYNVANQRFWLGDPDNIWNVQLYSGNEAGFSKNSFPNDPNLVINYLHTSGTMNINLYAPDGTLAQSYSNIATGSGALQYSLQNKPAGIWKMEAYSSIIGSWQRTVPVGFVVIHYENYPQNSFGGLTMGMYSKNSVGSDSAGITTALGCNISSYVNIDNYPHTISIGICSLFKDNDNSNAYYDKIRSVLLCVEKVSWDPNPSDGSQGTYGDSYSISNSAVRILNGGMRDSASDLLRYSDNGNYVSTYGEIGSVALLAVEAASGCSNIFVDLGMMALMPCMATWASSHNDYISDFHETDSVANVVWDNPHFSEMNDYVSATTYNSVLLHLSSGTEYYAFKIYAYFSCSSNGLNYEAFQTNPIYIIVAP